MVNLSSAFILDTFLGSAVQPVSALDVQKYLGRWFQVGYVIKFGCWKIFFYAFIIEVVFFLNNITLNFLLMFVVIVAIALYLFWYIFIDIKLITYSLSLVVHR